MLLASGNEPLDIHGASVIQNRAIARSTAGGLALIAVDCRKKHKDHQQSVRNIQDSFYSGWLIVGFPLCT